MKTFFEAIIGIISATAIIMILIVFFFGGNRRAYSRSQSESSAAVNTAQTQTTPAQTVPAQTVPVQETVVQTYTKDDLLADIRRALYESFGDECTARIEDNIIVIEYIPEGADYIQALLYTQLGDAETMRSWETLKDSMVNMSSVFRGAAVERGLEDVHIMVMMMNPLQKENTLLVVTDNVVFYDYFSESPYGNT